MGREQQGAERDDDEAGREEARDTDPRQMLRLAVALQLQNRVVGRAGAGCRNCLGDWYREAAAEQGIELGKDEARGLIYGMAPAEWKTRYQKEATPEQKAAFAASQQKTHS